MVTIRKMCKDDKPIVVDMMRRFYASPAVSTNGSDEIFDNNIETCISDSPYADGYIIVVDDTVIGYGIIAKSYSTEFGRKCIWIEDIYLEHEYRSRGIGSQFIQYIRSQYPKHLLRLEAESDNFQAVATYKKNNFIELKYMELISLPKGD